MTRRTFVLEYELAGVFFYTCVKQISWTANSVGLYRGKRIIITGKLTAIWSKREKYEMSSRYSKSTEKLIPI